MLSRISFKVHMCATELLLSNNTIDVIAANSPIGFFSSFLLFPANSVRIFIPFLKNKKNAENP